MIIYHLIAALMLSLPTALPPGAVSPGDGNDSIKARLSIIAGALKDKSEETAEYAFSAFLEEGQPDKTEWTAKYRTTLRLLDAVSSPMRDEDLLIPFLRAAIASGKLGEGDKMRADFRLEIAMKNRPGTPATDFVFADRKGIETSLMKVRSGKPILLIFFDPDCSHCMESINGIIGQGTDKKFTVVAIDIADDHDRWIEIKDSLPEEWVAGYAGPAIEDDDLYALLDTPTIYILNADGTVAVKDITSDKIKGYAESL